MAYIQKGETIGVLALSSPVEPGRFETGANYLKSLGFSLNIKLQPSKEYGKTNFLFSSDSARARAEALHELLSDKEVKVIISARGGYGAAEVLPYIDFDLVAKYPKTLVGFSDTTALLGAFAQRGAKPIHGPSLESAFSKYATSQAAKTSAQALVGLLTGAVPNPFANISLSPLFNARNFKGEIVGGNLCVLTALIGGPYIPILDQKILFLEETGERPYRIHRALLQLKQAGLMSGLAGVLLGSFNNCTHPKGEGATLVDVFKDIFSDCSFPVYSGLPSGHEEMNLAIPFGVPVSVVDNKLELSFGCDIYSASAK